RQRALDRLHAARGMRGGARCRSGPPGPDQRCRPGCVQAQQQGVHGAGPDQGRGQSDMGVSDPRRQPGVRQRPRRADAVDDSMIERWCTPRSKMNSTFGRFLAVVLIAAFPAFVSAGDWPMWGHDSSRNMVSDEKGLPTSFDAGQFKSGSEEIDMATTKNVRWVAKLGSQTYGNPTVAGGRVVIGTNNEGTRNPNLGGDRG